MRNYQEWMEAYGKDHQNHTNQLIHKICVPLIFFTVIGILWCLPTPVAFDRVPYLNWGTIFAAYSLCFYLYLNFKMFLGILVQTLIMCLICQKLYEINVLLPLSIVLFFLGWVAQFWGHKIEGKKPSFLMDLTFLLVGPMWVMRFLYNKIGINV